MKVPNSIESLLAGATSRLSGPCKSHLIYPAKTIQASHQALSYYNEHDTGYRAR